MRVIAQDEIRRRITAPRAIAAMREAVIAQSRGDCDIDTTAAWIC